MVLRPKSLQTIVPNSARIQMPFVISGLFSMTDEGTWTKLHYAFRASSCFDPDFTGAGHQPRGFDQWKLLYNMYIVNVSKSNSGGCKQQW